MALDIHVVTNGLIKQSWHIEDFASILQQVLNGEPIPDFGFDDEYIDYWNIFLDYLIQSRNKNKSNLCKFQIFFFK